MITIALLMANAHCYMRCSLASLDETHCHHQGKSANSACLYQHAISKRVVQEAPVIECGAGFVATDATLSGSDWAVDVTSDRSLPRKTAPPVLPLRI
jgi:hypothetical protein